MPYLMDQYPALALPHMPLADLPTPLQEAPALAQRLNAARLFVKRDDQTARPYGGNKVRKLEWLLADARAQGAKSVITFGAAGSNHALATALFARAAGLHPIAMLVPQPSEPVVRANLLRHLGPRTELHYFAEKTALRDGLHAVTAACAARDGVPPYIIPSGGSAPVGLLGYVNAAFELAAQCAEQGIPMPDRIYTACGTMGTAIGLLLGLALIGAPTHVEAVRVTEEEHANPERARSLFAETAHLLHANDESIPMPGFPEHAFTLRQEFFGDGYGVHTAADRDAATLFAEHAGVALECTYTAKAFRALIADGQSGRLEDDSVLFWDTYSAHAPDVETANYTQLPPELHAYFKSA